MINWMKYCTKEIFKILRLIIIGVAIISIIAGIKYKPAYKVTLAGEDLGFIYDKNFIDSKINKYMNNFEGNIASREIKDLPEYEFKLVDRNKETSERDVMVAVKGNVITTYKAYAVRLNGEQKAVVADKDEADKIINEIKDGLNEEIEMNLEVAEVTMNDFKVSSSDEAKTVLNEIKVAKVTEYETKKAEEAKAAEKAAQEKAAKAASEAAPAQVNSNWKIEIPKIGLSAPIAEGTSKALLNSYVGHFPETVAEGGNVGLAAHNRGYRVNYFANIKSLVPGDVIYYTYNGTVRTYTVVASFVIDSYDWDNLEPTGDERITMITCVENQPSLRRCVQAVRSN